MGENLRNIFPRQTQKMPDIDKPTLAPADKREDSEQIAQPGNVALLHRIRELEQYRHRHETLRKLSSYLKASLAPNDAYAAVEGFGPELFPGTTGRLYLAHPPSKYLEVVAAWRDTRSTEQTFTMQDCWALRRAQPHGVREASGALLCGHVAPPPKPGLPYLCVPLFAQGETIGLLNLQRLKEESAAPSDHGAWLDSSMYLAVAAAEEVGLALANLKLRETLHEQSIRDPLTGLYNRRFLEEFLMRELARADRKKHALSIITLDIDHFKRINDTLGHGAGDMVLRRVGLLLQGYVRESDIACRVGGEEFALLLPEVAMPIATQRAEDIRKAVHEMTLKHEDQNLEAITVSLGVACFPDHATTPEALIRAADQALYDAKYAGRDMVISAGPVSREPRGVRQDVN
jgi:diguanylate cyclase (GGDEF)-like protein